MTLTPISSFARKKIFELVMSKKTFLGSGGRNDTNTHQFHRREKNFS